MIGMFTGLVNINFTLPPQLSSYAYSYSYSYSCGEDIWYAAPLLALLMFASLLYSKRNKDHSIGTAPLIPHVSTEASSSSSQKSDGEQISCISTSQVTDSIKNVGVCYRFEEADAQYAEELQVQEALLASMLPATSQKTTLSTSLRSLLKEEECKICLEKQESWQMFRNSTCCHSFCYNCITKHAVTKMQEKNKTIPCPGINCKSTLDFNALRLIIPKQTLTEWDDFLCESMIPVSHRLYCPFTNCSVLLVNDDTGITKIDCPACRRSICAACRVPWHSDFSCKEYGKLCCKKGRKQDEMAVALAKKKKWRKCPNCHFFVEKAEGCMHITCRCKYEFCYDCGAKWSSTHGGCKRG